MSVSDVEGRAPGRETGTDVGRLLRGGGGEETIVTSDNNKIRVVIDDDNLLGPPVDGTPSDDDGDGSGSEHTTVSIESAKSEIKKKKFEGGGGHGHGIGGGVANSTVTQTAVNVIKSFIGAGVLSLPAAFAEGGLLASSIVMVCLAICSGYSMFTLVRCKHRIIDRHNIKVQSFSDVARYAYGGRMSRIVDTLLVTTQYGFCCAYVIFLAKTTRDIPLAPDWPWRFYAVLWSPILIGLSWIRSLKSLSFSSVVANITITIGMTTIVFGAFFVITGNMHFDTEPNIEWFVIPQSLIVVFNVGIYSFEGIGMILPLETAMKEPRKFSTMFGCCMIMITTAFVVFGCSGYIAWGDETSDIVTSNLDDFAGDSVAWNVIGNTVKLLLIIAIMLTYPLMLSVVTGICEMAFFNWSRVSIDNMVFKQNCIRAALVAGTIIVAISMPGFSQMVELIGALGSCPLQFIFPALFYLKLFPRGLFLTKFVAVFLVVLGVCGSLFGTVFTVMQIVEIYFGVSI
eukprot:TRINITY_DN2070_c0_g3_i2.p1 TRINITY_DN2070_c0_g3~~TRINITY_DN2070_c0_g3_i2.p1  ORF type:complete len:512 (+),score=118.28 TRINITY_DN2070_c0_g3_i2:171-1706(+)